MNFENKKTNQASKRTLKDYSKDVKAAEGV
jgi:hypothetical protein